MPRAPFCPDASVTGPPPAPPPPPAVPPAPDGACPPIPLPPVPGDLLPPTPVPVLPPVPGVVPPLLEHPTGRISSSIANPLDTQDAVFREHPQEIIAPPS